jgi:hypothetical protein
VPQRRRWGQGVGEQRGVSGGWLLGLGRLGLELGVVFPTGLLVSWAFGLMVISSVLGAPN